MPLEKRAGMLLRHYRDTLSDVDRKEGLAAGLQFNRETALKTEGECLDSGLADLVNLGGDLQRAREDFENQPDSDDWDG